MTYSSIIIPGSGGATADTTPPSVPGANSATNVCQNTFTLNWGASTDNVGVTGYQINKNSSLYTTVGVQTSYNVTGQTAGASANWQVRARDAAGNWSNFNSILSVTQGETVSAFTISQEGWANGNDACTDDIGYPIYKTGVSGTPNNGDVLYTNACGTARLSGGNLRWSDGTFNFVVSNSGVISSRANCI